MAAEDVLDFRPLVGQTVTILPASAETSGEVSRIELLLDGQQGGPPAHVHPGQQERYEVVSGQLTVKLGGKTLRLGSGEDVTVPIGMTHTFANQMDEPVRFLAEHRPALRFEDYLRSMHRLATSDYAKSRRSPTTLLRFIRAESAYPEVLRPPSGIPRLAVGALNGIAQLLRYPQSY